MAKKGSPQSYLNTGNINWDHIVNAPVYNPRPTLITDELYTIICRDIKDEITRFNGMGYTVDALKIYIPKYFFEMLFEYAASRVFISRVEPFKICNVEVVDGYENKIIIANSNQEGSSKTLTAKTIVSLS